MVRPLGFEAGIEHFPLKTVVLFNSFLKSFKHLLHLESLAVSHCTKEASLDAFPETKTRIIKDVGKLPAIDGDVK